MALYICLLSTLCSLAHTELNSLYFCIEIFKMVQLIEYHMDILEFVFWGIHTNMCNCHVFLSMIRRGICGIYTWWLGIYLLSNNTYDLIMIMRWNASTNFWFIEDQMGRLEKHSPVNHKKIIERINNILDTPCTEYNNVCLNDWSRSSDMRVQWFSLSLHDIIMTECIMSRGEDKSKATT